jgi:tRNA(Ile)-lysidine synthase
MLDKSWDILRPLLNITKPEILDYLNKNNIKYFIDESNFDSSYTRNFLRLDILPKLDKINKNYKQNLANLMNYLEENKDFIDREVVKFLWIEESDKTYFSVAEFNDISKFLQKEVIRYCFYIANNSSTIWLTEKNIAEIIKFINSKWNKTVKNIKNLKMFKDWDKLYYK